MKALKKRPVAPGIAAVAAIAAMCRWLPGFAALWQRCFMQPFAVAAACLSSKISFPLLELAVVALAGYFSIWLLCAAAKSARSLRWTPLAHWGRSLLRALAALFAIYVLAWLPAYWCDSPPDAAVPTEDIEVLCHALISELNASGLRFPDTDGALRAAEAAASAYGGVSLPVHSVKTARYPEWMNHFKLAGFYSPWTGEALVNPNLSPVALPFTACHELMHRLGVADEGRANIAAWQACLAAGGEMADSARLWALRYAMGALRPLDESAWRTCAEAMRDPVAKAFSGMNGFSSPTSRRSSTADSVAAFAGLGRSACNYDALVAWLAAEYGT